MHSPSPRRSNPLRHLLRTALLGAAFAGILPSVRAEGFPPAIVPERTGIAAHTNTGIDYGIPENNDALNEARGADFKFVRFVIPWHDVEREALSFEAAIPWGYLPGYVQFLETFRSKSFRPIIVLAFNNAVHTDAGKVNTAAERKAFARYCFFIAWKFRSLDPMFEIWNEPNLDAFTEQEYVALVEEASDAVRLGWHFQREDEGLPDPLIIGPGVANAWAPGNFIDRTFDEGLLDLVDAVSFHPYADNNPDVTRRIPETLASPIASIRAEFASRGYPDMPIVLTEWGWSTHTTSSTSNQVDEATQAKFAVRQVLMGYYLDITINCIYSLADARNDDQRSAIANKHYGMFKTTGGDFNKVLTAKPAVDAVDDINHNLKDHYYVERIDMGNAGNLDSEKDWCLVFYNPNATDYDGSPGDAKVVLWTTETGVTKTTPDLMPLMGLDQPRSTTFTDMPKVAGVNGYTPPSP